MPATLRSARTLLALTRAALGDGPFDRLDRTDWEAVLGLACREEVAALLHTGLTGPWAEAVLPSAFSAGLAHEYRKSRGRAVLHAAALAELTGALADAGVETMVVKGMVLAETLYGDAATRPMSDLDVVVRRADARTTARVLGSLGYTPLGRFERDLRRRAASAFAPGGDRAARPVVDVHWSLVESWYGARPGGWPRGAWERSRVVALAGQPARTLAPSDALLHAACHLAGNHGLRGLLWLCDLRLMTSRWSDELDWDRIVAMAAASRLAPMLWAALRVADAAVGLDVSAGIMKRLARAVPWRTRAAVRALLPRLLALRSLPRHEYVVPLLLVARRRDLARVVARRLPGASRAVPTAL